MRCSLQLFLPLCALQLQQLVALTAQECRTLLNLLGIYLKMSEGTVKQC
jgi:hypothetical protein